MTRAQSRMVAALDSPTRVRARESTRPARREAAPDLAGIFECSPVPMAVASSEGLVQRMNAAMEMLLADAGAAPAGPAADPLRALTLDQVVPIPLPEIAPVAEVLGGRRRAASFDAVLGAAESARLARVTICTLRPGAAAPPALVTVEDRTGQRRAEARAAELDHQLRHVARLSLAGELCGSLAHEMGQPLAAVANYTQAAIMQLTRQGRAGDSLSHLHAADAAAQRAARVLRNLAGFVRAGRCERQRENLCDLVAETRELINAAAASAGLRADVQVLGDSLPVHIDRVQIQQVLLNLVRNAAEATRAAADGAAGGGSGGGGGGGEGGGPVLVRVWSPEEGVAEVAVRDAGPGLPAAVLERLFTPFFTTKPRGMGLGLAICRSIIEAHGGELRGENNPPPAPGATFRIRLPIQTNPGEKSYDG